MIAAIIVGSHLAVAVADRPPTVNFEQTCRDETTANKGINDKFDVCIAAEKHARDQLTAQWSSFNPAARTRCARESTSGQSASYLELLVCLELDQADREVHGQGSTMGITTPEEGRGVGERDEGTDSNQSRPAPNRAAPVVAPSRPASVPRPAQQPVARSAVTAPAAPAPAEPPPPPPPPPPSPPVAEAEPASQADVLRQSFCRSPLGYVLPGC